MHTKRAQGLLLLTLTVFVALLAACRGASTSPNLDVRMTIEPSPPCVGPAEVTLFIVDKNDNPVHGAQVRIEANMNHAGMRPVFADAREDSAGTYVADLRFTMAGDWFLLVTTTLPNGDTVETKLPVPNVRSTCP